MESKIIVSTLCWKRPEIFEMFCKNMSRLNPKPHVVCAGSPGDECEHIAKKYGVEYTQWDNSKMGQKANRSALLAKGKCEYILLTGDDDIISQSMWEYYNRFTGEVLALSDLYFFDITTQRLLYWGGYDNSNKARIGEPIGAYKMIRADVMDKMNWLPFSEKAYQPGEHVTHAQLIKLGINQTIVKMEETGGIAVDVKSKQNLNPIKQWPNSKFIGLDILHQNPDIWQLLQETRDEIKHPSNRANPSNGSYRPGTRVYR
jgi:hypothetical protein